MQKTAYEITVGLDFRRVLFCSQAEDGIRDHCVTGVQTCALPIPARLRELQQLAEQLQAMDPFEAEARYVDTFDRGHQTSLHLFEHVHGDSADRKSVV